MKLRNMSPWVPVSIFLSIIVCLCFSSCEQRSGVATESSGAVSFEIRDFMIEREDDKEWGTTYRGRGTVVSRSPAVEGETVLLYLDAKNTAAPEGKPDRLVVTLRDGIGQLETTEWFGSREHKVPNYEWTLVGWTPLQAGKLEFVRPSVTK